MTDQLDRLDYYTLLQVADDANTDVIRAAFHAFALRYHPDRFAGAPRDKSERAAQIYRRGAEGYRVLLDPAMRSEYDRGLGAGRLRLTTEDTRREEVARRRRSGQLGVRTRRARPFVTKAQQAAKAGDLSGARLNLKLALSHEPDNAMIQARLADVEQRLKDR